MTVKELIEHLQTMPQDAIVICTFCSDYDVVTKEDITLYNGRQKLSRTGATIRYGGLIRHKGHLMHYDESWGILVNFKKREILDAPQYLTAVHFKGN